MSGYSSGTVGLGATFNTNQSLVSDTKRLIDSAEEAAFTFISSRSTRPRATFRTSRT